jgi:hypothetical protein
MKVTVQVVVQAGEDAEAPSVVREVLSVDREALAPDTLGLQRGEAMDLLSAVQGALVDEQAKAALATQVACPECGRPRRHKDCRTIVVRSLFGTLRLASPRWWHCGCRPQMNRPFSPLAAVLPTRATPELQYLEAKFAGQVSACDEDAYRILSAPGQRASSVDDHDLQVLGRAGRWQRREPVTTMSAADGIFPAQISYCRTE